MLLVINTIFNLVLPAVGGKYIALIALLALMLPCIANGSERQVGMAYSTWFPPNGWSNTWSEPELGCYDSADPHVIRQHAEWLSDAGVDFIWIDWSNNIKADPTDRKSPQRSDLLLIERATRILFEEYTRLKRHPKISIFLGCPDHPKAIEDGSLQRKVDQVYKEYVADPRFRPLIQDYLGKPLLVIYVGTPSPFQNGTPKWDDPRFTVRWMTGFLTQQHNLISADLISKYGYWSWEDRGKQTYSVFNDQPEAMVVTACWRDDPECPAPGRRGGKTFREQWSRARQIGTKFAMVVSWNEWCIEEQPSPEISKDIEPSKAFGHLYLDILKEEIARFKSGK